MAQDPSKYTLLSGHESQEFEIFVGDSTFETPRLRLVWPDKVEMFLYFNAKDMDLILGWAKGYVK